MKIVFFGTPDFAAHHLKYLLERGENIVAVVTREDKPKGRSLKLSTTPVKEAAQSLAPQIPVYQPKKASTDEFVAQMKALEPDLFIVVAYGEIISQELLDTPRLACVNVHASLLPKYRGAAPIQRAIMNGDKESGVTIMHMCKKMDAGEIICQQKVAISSDMTAGELHDALMHAGTDAIGEALDEFKKGVFAKVPQDESQVTYAKKINQDECKLNFTSSATDLYNRYRGVSPSPGAWCWVSVRGKKKRLKIEKCSIVSQDSKRPGEIILYSNEGIVISCAQEALRLEQIKLEGKKSVTAEEFIRGFSRDDLEFS